VQLGQAQASIELFRKAVQLLPDKVEPQYWLGRTLINLGQKAEGQKILLKVQDSHSAKQTADRKTLSGTASPAATHTQEAPP
jgi:predicted Zn-dependent protease